MILMPHGGFGAVIHKCLPNDGINQLSPWCRPLPWPRVTSALCRGGEKGAGGMGGFNEATLEMIPNRICVNNDYIADVISVSCVMMCDVYFYVRMTSCGYE